MNETIEWFNYWIEDAEDRTRRRILLIGDSVARDYRKILNREVKKTGLVVDLLAMSRGIFDELFTVEIYNFFNTIGVQYQYQYVFF